MTKSCQQARACCWWPCYVVFTTWRMWAFWEQSHLGTKPFGYNRWAFWVQWWALWVQWWALWVQWWAFWVQLTGPFGYILLGPLGTIYIRIINSVGLLGTIGGPFGYNSDSKERYMLGVFIANNTLLYCPKQSFMPISTCLNDEKKSIIKICFIFIVFVYMIHDKLRT